MRRFGKPISQLAIAWVVVISAIPIWAQTTGTYSDFSTQTLMSGNFTGTALDAAALDFDRDGMMDLFIGAEEAAWRQIGPALLGVPTFEDLHTSVLNGEDFPTNLGSMVIAGYIIADFDNDGYTDIYVPSWDADEGHLLYHCDPSTTPPPFR